MERGNPLMKNKSRQPNESRLPRKLPPRTQLRTFSDDIKPYHDVDHIYNPMANFSKPNLAQLEIAERMKMFGRWPVPEMLMHRPNRNYRLNVDDIMIDAYAEAIVKGFQGPDEAN